jgi:hypothetical protein
MTLPDIMIEKLMKEVDSNKDGCVSILAVGEGSPLCGMYLFNSNRRRRHLLKPNLLIPQLSYNIKYG